MTAVVTAAAAFAAASIPLVSIPDPVESVGKAAQRLLADLERGQRINAGVLRSVMEAAFGASDATGAWDWKIAYDACEAATVLFLRKYGKALLCKAGSPAAMLPMLAKIVGLLPTHTRPPPTRSSPPPASGCARCRSTRPSCGRRHD